MARPEYRASERCESEDEMYMAPSAFVLLYWGVETVRESL
jgi:hypothetical protein